MGLGEMWQTLRWGRRVQDDGVIVMYVGCMRRISEALGHPFAGDLSKTPVDLAEAAVKAIRDGAYFKRSAAACSESLARCSRERRLDVGLPTGAIDLVARERLRQIEVEGWTAEHDDAEHSPGELAIAGRCYAQAAIQQLAARIPADRVPPAAWPFEDAMWKPSGDPLRNLEKAGALIVAEMDRKLRAGRKDG